jgi:hypothetical protein
MAVPSDKKKGSLLSEGLDYASGGSLGAFAAGASSAAYHFATGKVADPYYSPHLEEKAQKEFYKALRGKTRFFKRTVGASLVGAAAGLLGTAYLKAKRRKEDKKTAFSKPIKAMGVASLAALGIGAYKHRGKLYLMATGNLDKVDP